MIFQLMSLSSNAMGNAQDISVLGNFFLWVVDLAETPIQMWGYTFNMLQCIYGITVMGICTDFARRLTASIKASNYQGD